MTRDADFKKLVRARMSEFDESYLQARTALMQTSPPSGGSPARALGHPRVHLEHDPIVPADLRRSVRQFFEDGHLRSIAVKRSKRMAVLIVLVALFEPHRTYTEAEVSRMLGGVHEDHAYLRRELVNAGYLTREAGRYTLAPALPVRDARWAQEFPREEVDVFAALWHREAPTS